MDIRNAAQGALAFLLGLLAITPRERAPTTSDGSSRPQHVLHASASPDVPCDARLSGVTLDTKAKARPERDCRIGHRLLERFFAGTAFDRSAVRLRVIVAMVPDPREIRQRFAYDNEVEAIRAALEASHLSLDRFDVSAFHDSSAGAGSRDASKAASIPPAPLGAMLYREVSATLTSVSLVLVYLVPELPTSGADSRALAEALSEEHALVHHTDAPYRRADDAKLRVLGPAFSGGDWSLSAALLAASAQDACQPRPDVMIVSGSASGSSAFAMLRADALKQRYASVNAFTTVHSTEALSRTLREFVLPRLGVDESEVAYLVESSTQFGGGAIAALDSAVNPSHGEQSDTSTRPGDPSQPAGPAASASARTARGEDRGPRFLQVRFPLHISSLREMSSESTREGAAPLPGLQPSRARVALPLNGGNGGWTDPAALSELTPASVSLALDDLAELLRAKQVRAVVIVATDARDYIFLSVELRRRLRDVQFISQGGLNRLLLHADVNESMRGTLLVGTYPLLPESEEWPWSAERTPISHVLLASEEAEGAFNATVFLLDRTGRSMDYCDVVQADRVCARPPIWALMVGRGSFVPLFRRRTLDDAALMWSDSLARLRQPTDYSPPEGDSHTPILLRLLLLFAAGTLAHALFSDWRKAAGLDRDAEDRRRATTMDMAGTPERDAFCAHQLERRAYLLGRGFCVGTIMALIALFAMDVMSPLPMSRGEVGGAVTVGIGLAWLLFMLLAPVAPGLVAVVMDTKAWWSAVPARATGSSFEVTGALRYRSLGWVTVMLVVMGASSAAALWLMGAVTRLSPSSRHVFAEQSRHLASGGSIFVPVMLACLVGALWSSFNISRLRRLSRARAFPECLASGSGPPPADLKSLLKSHRRTLLCETLGPTDQIGSIVLLSVLALAVALWLQIGFVPAALTFSEAWARVSVVQLVALAVVSVLLVLTLDGLRAARLVYEFNRFLGRFAASGTFRHLVALPRAARATLRPDAVREDSGTELARLTLTQAYRLHALLQSSEGGAIVTARSTLPQALATALSARGVAAGSAESTETPVPPKPARPRLSDDSPANRALVTSLLLELDATTPAAPAQAPAVSTSSAAGTAEDASDVPVGVRAISATLLSLLVAADLSARISQVRRFFLFCLSGMILAAALLVSYPFEGQVPARVTLVVIMAATVSIFVAALIGLNRDRVLSKLTGTDPDKLTWEAGFVLQTLALILVPIGTIISWEFPEARAAVFAWLTPVLHSLGH
ncbi:MAG: hypothetical protein HY275_05785 [Gemmatimonadetes bacterium]|nr:hypothetical protein [Gemmatimonadota bacterium]